MNKIANLLLLLPLFGCATDQDKFSYLKIWNDKWQVCDSKGKASLQAFPYSDWFDRLPREDEGAVLFYIYTLKRYECTEIEANNLKLILDDEEITTLNEVLQGFVYFDPPSNEEVSHLNRREIDNIAQQFDTPFDFLRIAERIGIVAQ